jgi:hypothetical protein
VRGPEARQSTRGPSFRFLGAQEINKERKKKRKGKREPETCNFNITGAKLYIKECILISVLGLQ